MLNTRRQPRASVWWCGRVSSTNWPGCEADRGTRLEAELPDRRRERRRPTRSRRMARRCPKKKAIRLPTSSASCGELVDRRRPMRTPSGGTGEDRDQRRDRRTAASGAGGSVRGSLSMKPAKNEVGDDTSANVSASIGDVPAVTDRDAGRDRQRRRRTLRPERDATRAEQHEQRADHDERQQRRRADPPRRDAEAGEADRRPRRRRPGLKMWRRRNASRYFDATAAVAASARPASPASSGVGWKTKSRMSAVMAVELSCGCVRKITPKMPFARYENVKRTVALTSSSNGRR